MTLMLMRVPARTGVLLLLLAGTIWLVVRAPERTTPASANRQVAAHQAVSHRQEAEPAPRTTRQTIEPAARDPFVAEPVAPPKIVRAPVKPTPVAAPSAPPPAPVAPPLPFRFFGRMTGPDGKPSLYVDHQGQLVPLREGGLLAQSWRVDRIGDQFAVLTYLPLGQVQNLPFASER